MRIAAGVAIAVPYLLLVLLWGLGVVPTTALLPLLTAPLAVRLGETISHRSTVTSARALREVLVFFALFVALLALGLSVPAGGS